jgi:hypothetical protein
MDVPGGRLSELSCPRCRGPVVKHPDASAHLGPCPCVACERERRGEPRAPWEKLRAGDQFEVTSRSGHHYELSFLSVGPTEAGLYVRTRDHATTRLHPGRVDWSTLKQHTNAAEPILPGDKISIGTQGGTEHEGQLVEPIDDRVVLANAHDEGTFSAHLTRTRTADYKLMFHTKSLYPGEEFRVSSFSRRSYRGHVMSASQGRLRFLESGAEARKDLKIGRLNLETLEVLVRVPVSLLGCSPTAA